MGKKRVARYSYGVSADSRRANEGVQQHCGAGERARGRTRKSLYMWREQLDPESVMSRKPGPPRKVTGGRTGEGGRAAETGVGRQDSGVGFFQRCLAKSRGSTPAEQKLWRQDIYDQIREVMSLQGSLSVERMCQLAQVSRAGFYRSLQEQEPDREEMELRAAIQQIFLEHRRRYGYRRITKELRRRHDGEPQTSAAADAKQTICWRCSGALTWLPRIPNMSWRSI